LCRPLAKARGKKKLVSLRKQQVNVLPLGDAKFPRCEHPGAFCSRAKHVMRPKTLPHWIPILQRVSHTVFGRLFLYPPNSKINVVTVYSEDRQRVRNGELLNDPIIEMFTR